MNGDEVRNTTFMRRSGPNGYDVAEVDGLLDRVAAELDAGRPARPLVENATFRLRSLRRGYSVDAVDWFLAQLLRREDRPEAAGTRADPWRDLAVVAQFTRRAAGDPAGRSAKASRRETRTCFAEECKQAWADFGRPPGLRLRAGWAGKGRRELRTAEQQTVASFHGEEFSATVSLGGRSFTLRPVSPKSPKRATWPGVAEAAARSYQDRTGHFSGKTASSREQRAARLQALVDEAGTPILYRSGENYSHMASACVSFPDRRWLRFLVRGTQEENAIMTAVDQAGNKVLRCRVSCAKGRKTTLEVTMHPDRQLTDELVLAIAMSDYSWLTHYFHTG